MSAISLKVWTYWEGPFTEVQRICLASIDRVVGPENHVHVTRDTLRDYVDVPQYIMDTYDFLFRAEFGRAALLHDYGGLWLDTDVLLLRDPFQKCGIREKTWKERYTGRKKTISVGAVYCPFPKGGWMVRTLELMHAHKIDGVRGMAMSLFNKAYEEQAARIEVGPWQDYYSVTCTNWQDFWTGFDLLDKPDIVAHHLWWGAITRAKSLPYANIGDRARLMEVAPQSLLAEYSRRHLGG